LHRFSTSQVGLSLFQESSMESHYRWRLKGAVFSLCLLLAARGAWAQETTAGIQGTVKDSTGAVVSNATVEVSGTKLIGTRKVQTDTAGYYRFSSLPPGEYTISVSSPNFRSYRQSGIELTSGRLPTIDVELQVGAVTETVEVTEEAPIVDVTQSKVQVVVPEAILDNVPKGRSFQSVIPFAPGARQEPLQSRRDDTNRANGFQIDGASDSENVYMVEGLDTTDIEGGGIGRNVPMEFIQEVQIKSSSFEAEFGGALGGVVNVVQKKGSNNWHGSLVAYYRSSDLNANDQCGTTPFPNPLSAQQIACGLRGNPARSLSTAQRLDQDPEYYIQKEDYRRIIEPGFELGGPILVDRLWTFVSYVPTIDRWRRTVNFQPTVNLPNNIGQRMFERRADNHNGLARLDGMIFSNLRGFASWQYGYRRIQGQLPLTPDSAMGQTNLAATTDQNTIRSDAGATLPGNVFNFGADWTPTSRATASVRYGEFFENRHDIGFPKGLRYLYVLDASTAVGLDGTPVRAQFAQRSGFNNIGDNLSTTFDEYRRRALNTDFSYALGNFFGSHAFKVGYGFNRLSNKVLRNVDHALVRLSYGDDYSVGTATGQANCAAIRQQNIAMFGQAGSLSDASCQGRFGHFIVRDGLNVTGVASSYNHAVYVQDAWTVGRGLTINAGVRLDKEYIPPYSAGAPDISFGFGDKVAPRIGAAYDLFRNGKVKVYGSYGKFYDITKYSLPRGSFGGDYWRDCVYALDTDDYNSIVPTAPEIEINGIVSRHACPPGDALTQAPGITARFIENLDFRHTVGGPGDPGIDPDLKPMSQHEYVLGTDWQLSRNLGVELRYSRKRLDHTIEDIALTDSTGFYIGNPGPGFGDLLKRALPSSGITAPQCPDCPPAPEAVRNYDGVEVRLTKRASETWWGSVSYTYSRLYGNYSGHTASDITDGNGGRHSPNNNRAFDHPQMSFDAYGNYIHGPLATDRPHTLKAFGFYRLKWLGQETTFGASQYVYSGTPVSTCLPTVGTLSSCVFVEGRGNWVQLHREPDGTIVRDGVIRGFRTPAFTQSDLSLVHEIKVGENENQRVGFEVNVQNLLNERNVLSINPTPLATGTVTPTAANDSGVDFHSLLTGWDYMALMNSQGKVFESNYGLPFLFQPSRQLRLAVRYTF
jgi:hypothetical protein